MSWFTDLFSSGVSEVVTSVGDTIDKLVTSDEEKLTLKNELQTIMNDFEEKQLTHIESMEQQVTDRHKVDMQSDSWLSKNVRPLTLIFLTVTTVLLAYFTIFADLTTQQTTALDSWLPLFQTLLVTAYSFMYGGRVIEKVKGVAGQIKK